jgi:antitoxin component of MazEF toxin-antitoxin module
MAIPVEVKKWGNSMAVLIPGQFARSRKIHVGAMIDLEPVRVVKPRRRRYKLSELVAKMKPEHRHTEWDLGRPAGREIW